MLAPAFAVVQVTEEEPDSDEDEHEGKDGAKEACEDRGDGRRFGGRGAGVRSDRRSAGCVSDVRTSE